MLNVKYIKYVIQLIRIANRTIKRAKYSIHVITSMYSFFSVLNKINLY